MIFNHCFHSPKWAFFALLFLGSCGQTTAPNTAVDTIPSGSIQTPITTISTSSSWDTLEGEARAKALRAELLKRKENVLVKESVLQELYIRNMITIANDSLLFNIPFDLHGLDGGAPDCYSTDVRFRFKLGNAVQFPKTLQVEEYEHGCVDREYREMGLFQLMEQTDTHVLYHSIKHKKTLVLFRSCEDSGSAAYFFTGVGTNHINGENVYTILKDDMGDENAIHPWRGNALTTLDYERFLSSK